MKTCEQCNLKYKDNIKFCPECGAQLKFVNHETNYVGKEEIFSNSSQKTMINKENNFDESWFKKFSGKFELEGIPGLRPKAIVTNGHLIVDGPVVLVSSDIELSDIISFGFSAVKYSTKYFIDWLSLCEAKRTGNVSGTIHLTVPRNSKYDVYIRGSKFLSGITLSFKNIEYYSKFVNLLWKACGKMVIRKILYRLRNGEKIVLDCYNKFADDGVEHEVMHLFSENEFIKYGWDELERVTLIKHEGKKVRIEFTDSKLEGSMNFMLLKMDSEISFNIFESLLALQNLYQVKRMSDILLYF